MKRIIALLILLFASITILYTVYNSHSTELTAARRTLEGNTEIVYIDDEAIALAGNPSADIEMRKLAVEAYEQTNVYRESKGLTPLVWSERLVMDAHVRAEELETRFAHIRPNSSDWYTVDSEYMYGENLAQGYDEAADVVIAWVNSPSHRENLEDTEFLTCGISAWRGANGNIYIAQEFGY